MLLPDHRAADGERCRFAEILGPDVFPVNVGDERHVAVARQQACAFIRGIRCAQPVRRHQERRSLFARGFVIDERATERFRLQGVVDRFDFHVPCPKLLRSPRAEERLCRDVQMLLGKARPLCYRRAASGTVPR